MNMHGERIPRGVGLGGASIIILDLFEIMCDYTTNEVPEVLVVYSRKDLLFVAFFYDLPP